MDIQEQIEYTNLCYSAATGALNELIANISPAPHATIPLSALIEEMKQSLVAMHTNTKTILYKINNQQNEIS